MSKAKQINKPWGKEIWFAHSNGLYVGKILIIKKGHRLSLQYHKQKDETFYLEEGKVKVSYGKKADKLVNVTLKKGSSLRMKPGTIHRMHALDDSRILESSTPQVTDVIRIEDDYKRGK